MLCPLVCNGKQLHSEVSPAATKPGNQPPSIVPPPRTPPSARARRIRANASATWSRICLALAVFGVVLICGLWVRTIIRIDIERDIAIGDATRKSALLAMAFEERTLRTLGEIDHVLLAAERYAQGGPRLDLRQLRDQGRAAGTVIRDLAVLDRDGHRVATLGDSGAGGPWEAQHLALHRRPDGDDMYVGRPIAEPRTGIWTIHASRRIERPDGAFAGVVVASLDAARFTGFHRDVYLGAEDAVALIGLDGISRVRQAGSAVTFGQDMRPSTLFSELARHSLGDFVGRGRLDGVPRFYSFRTLPRHGLVALVGTSQAKALAPFRARERIYLLVAVLGSALIAAFLGVIAFALRRQARSMQQLSQAE